MRYVMGAKIRHKGTIGIPITLSSNCSCSWFPSRVASQAYFPPSEERRFRNTKSRPRPSELCSTCTLAESHIDMSSTVNQYSFPSHFRQLPFVRFWPHCHPSFSDRRRDILSPAKLLGLNSARDIREWCHRGMRQAWHEKRLVWASQQQSLCLRHVRIQLQVPAIGQTCKWYKRNLVKNASLVVGVNVNV